MQRKFMPRVGGALAMVALLAGASVQARAQAEESARVREAARVFHAIMNAPDKAIPDSVLHKAAAIAVFPSVIKAGFVFGVTIGHGIISVRDPKTGAWSAPAFLTITGGSFGAQIGGAATDLVLIIMNRQGVRDLLRNQFKIGGEASAAAGPVGREAQAATDLQLRAEILSYSRSRGLFAGIAINGASVRQDLDANEAFYGRRYTSRQITLEHLHLRGPSGPIARWREALNQYVH